MTLEDVSRVDAPSTSVVGNHSVPGRVDMAGGFPDVDDVLLGSLRTLSTALHVGRNGVDHVLDALLAMACRMVPQANGAGVNLIIRQRFEPQAVLGSAPHALDAFQQATGAGPCIEASQRQLVVDIVDMRLDERWPAFAARAVDLGVLSMVCIPLWVDERRLGSLSLYGGEIAVFESPARNVAELLATHAAIALADAQHVTHLQQALVNRDVIGQAKGILMERLRLTPDQAFDLLTKASQQLNRKLADVAETLTLTGELPAR